MGKQFHVSQEVTILGISLFVLGLGLGPLVASPISDIYGRRIVYCVSFSLFFVFTFPVAFAPNISKCVLVRRNRPWGVDVAVNSDSRVSGLSVHFWVLRIRVSQLSWWQRE